MQKLMSFSNNFVGHRLNQRFGGFFPTGFMFGFDLVSMYDKTNLYADRFKIQIANIGDNGNKKSFPIWNWNGDKYVDNGHREIKNIDSPFMGSNVEIGQRNIALANNQNSGCAIINNNGSLIYLLAEGQETFAETEIDISGLNSNLIYYATVWLGLNYDLSGNPTETDNININWYIDDLSLSPVNISSVNLLDSYETILTGQVNPLVPISFSGYNYISDRDNFYREYLTIIEKLRNISLFKLNYIQNYVEEGGKKYYLTPVGSLIIPLRTGHYPVGNENMFITKMPEYYDSEYFYNEDQRSVKFIDERSQITMKTPNIKELVVPDDAPSRVISIDYGIRSNANIMNLLMLLQTEILNLKLDNLNVLAKLRKMESTVLNNELAIDDLKTKD